MALSPLGTTILFIGIFLLIGSFIPGSSMGDPTSLQDMTYLTEEFPPLNYLENGTPTGLGVDLLLAIIKEAGSEIQANNIRILPLHEGLETTCSTPGTVIFSIARTPEREYLYQWVGPFTSYDIVLYSSRTHEIQVNSSEELAQYTIGAITGDVSVEELKRLGVQPDKIKTDPDPLVLFRFLDEGTVDLVASGSVAGESFSKKATGKVGFYKKVYQISSMPLYYAFNNETPQTLIDEFKKAFDRLKQTPEGGGISRYDQIISTWIPSVGFSTLMYLTEDYAPYNFPENGTLKGISVDILGEVFNRLNTNISTSQVKLASWNEGYQKALNQTGTVLFSTARTAERENLFLWAGPIFRSSQVIFSHSSGGKNITGSHDLAGMGIGVITDDVAAQDLKNTSVKEIVYASDAKTLIIALEEGSIDGWAYAELPGHNLISRYATDPDSIHPVYTISTHDYYFAFNGNTPVPLVQSFQQALDLMWNETDKGGVSSYDQILYQYIEPSSVDSPITQKMLSLS